MEVQNTQHNLLQSKLVQHIIEDQFDKESGIICEAIHKRDKITLQQLCSVLKNTLDEKSIKNLLIQLIKYGMIQFESNKNTNQYFINHQMVLNILRFPSFLKHTKQLYGSDAEHIIEYFLYNFQGSFEQCSSFVLVEKKKLDMEESKASLMKKKLKDAFIQLVKANYLQTFQKEQNNEVQELSELQKDQQSINNKKQDINSKRQRGEDKDKIDFQIRKQLKVAQTNLIDDDDLLQEDIENILPVKETKREEQSLQDDNLIYDSITKENQNYQINIRQFIYDFRTEEITKLADGKLNIQAKQILKVMLDSSQKIGRAQEIKTTEFLSLDQIKQLLQKTKGKEVSTIKDEDLQKLLSAMNLNGKNSKEMYAVNLERIIKKIKIRHIAQIIERKHNQIAGRIFRILKKYEYLEEKAISEIALQSLKDTQIYLNKLLNEGYIQLKNIKASDISQENNMKDQNDNKEANDHKETNQKKLVNDSTVNLHCLFKNDYERLDFQTVENYYQALINLKTKLQAAKKQEKELEQKKKNMVDDQEILKQWQQTLKLIMNLEVAIIETDTALLAFTEF